MFIAPTLNPFTVHDMAVAAKMRSTLRALNMVKLGEFSLGYVGLLLFLYENVIDLMDNDLND